MGNVSQHVAAIKSELKNHVSVIEDPSSIKQFVLLVLEILNLLKAIVYV